MTELNVTVSLSIRFNLGHFSNNSLGTSGNLGATGVVVSNEAHPDNRNMIAIRYLIVASSPILV